MVTMTVRAAVVVALAGALATSAAAQGTGPCSGPNVFSPLCNNLKCYRITDQPIVKTLVLDNQFGRERVVKLTPLLLCVPTQKICCANPPTTSGCQVVPCPPDPTTNQPAPVDHFKCYKIGEKVCTATDPTCLTLSRFNKNVFNVTLLDQFGQETVNVGAPKLLCVPVQKIVNTPTTTSTSSTTITLQTTTTSTSTTSTTRPGCQLMPGSPPMCGGTCDSGFVCLFPPGGTQCECVPDTSRCPAQTFPNCTAGACPSPVQLCHPPSGANTCGCCNQSGVACTTGSDCCSGTCLAASNTCQ